MTVKRKQKSHFGGFFSKKKVDTTLEDLIKFNLKIINATADMLIASVQKHNDVNPYIIVTNLCKISISLENIQLFNANIIRDKVENLGNNIIIGRPDAYSIIGDLSSIGNEFIAFNEYRLNLKN
jgi:hypothetical protein